MSTYSYDHANRLVNIVQGAVQYEFRYNGLGDRLQQTVNGEPTTYTLDLNAGLTQVLADGTNAYLYGAGRIGEEQPGGWQLHLADALGSVRHLGDASASVTLAQAYEPFGEILSFSGLGSTPFGFAGEQRDGTGLVYLRARYYDPYLNQWIQPDTILPDPRMSADWNRYVYVQDNPVNFIDPSGRFKCQPMPKCHDWLIHALVQLDVSAGPFGDIVYGAFDRLDKARVEDTLYIDFFTGTELVPGPGISLINYRIFLPRAYINNALPPPPNNVAHFAHEVVHQVQSIGERLSIWGEAQAYIFWGKIIEEFGKSPQPYIAKIIDRAYDLGSSSFTTTDRKSLDEVRRILTETFKVGLTHEWYAREPLLPWDIVKRCDP